MAYEMCDLCTVKHLLALPCSTTQMARAHIWPAGQPVQGSEVMATGTRSICNILTQVPYVQVEVFGAQGCHNYTLYSAEKCQLVLAEVAKVLMKGVA